jgi:cathepsin A (carboxypeptidase C)/serine carboxypeptidase-like clade 1
MAAMAVKSVAAAVAVAVLLVGLVGHTEAAAAQDEILSLPGWSGRLPSRQYSGYLNFSQTKHIHYW